MKADATDEFYNVGTGKRTSLKELAKALNLTGCNKEIQYSQRSQNTSKEPYSLAIKATEEINFIKY